MGVVTDLDRHLPAIQLGDEAEFGRWMAAAEPRLRGSLRSFGAAVDIEAMLQESFLQVWQVAPEFRPDGKPNALLRFAFRCARNLAISEIRRLRTHSADVDELERTLAQTGEVSEPVDVDPAFREILSNCAARLPDKPRSALAARITGGGTEPDRILAERLGMKLNTFLQNVTRARKLLLDCLATAGVTLTEQLA